MYFLGGTLSENDPQHNIIIIMIIITVCIHNI